MIKYESLAQLTDAARDNATQKYKIIEPYINDEQTLKVIAENKSIPVRTLGLWVKKYREQGLVGLARQSRCDKGLPRQYESPLQKTIEGIYLKKPMLSGANIHKLITEYCHQNKLKVPSYRSVCRVIFNIPDDMVILGHKEVRLINNNMTCYTFAPLSIQMSYGRPIMYCSIMMR